MLVITQPFMIVKYQIINAGLVRFAHTPALSASRWDVGVSALSIMVVKYQFINE